MQVFALTGPSGTGKSTSALSFAHEKNIPAIIDDGLLIFHGKRISGTSAKFERSMVSAVKRATFYFENHAEEIKSTIQAYDFDKILLIGTSIKMVNLMASNLQLKNISYYVDIESIRSSGEIKLAMFTRKTTGDHLMPIPFAQVEQGFFKKVIKQGFKIFTPKKELAGETTLVRPDFHKDSLIIYTKVFKNIVWNVCLSFEEIASCEKILVQFDGLPKATIELKLYYHKVAENIIGFIKNIQLEINGSFDTHLNLELDTVDISVLKLV